MHSSLTDIHWGIIFCEHKIVFYVIALELNNIYINLFLNWSKVKNHNYWLRFLGQELEIIREKPSCKNWTSSSRWELL
jgi:hypothetical protein